MFDSNFPCEEALFHNIDKGNDSKVKVTLYLGGIFLSRPHLVFLI